MLNPFTLVVWFAHKPATFFLILVHKVRTSVIKNYFGPMCDNINEEMNVSLPSMDELRRGYPADGSSNTVIEWIFH